MVEFRLDGEQFELTQDLVRHRIAAHHPESIQQYWVEIDGRRWPVKQVMALATGLDRSRFQSQNSRRLLAKLGFTVGAGAHALPADRAAQSGPRTQSGSFDITSLPELEQLQVNVALTWRHTGPVVLDDNGFPQFPALPRDPGLYRFDFGTDADGVRTLYIGESKSLARRASNYRNAETDRSTQRTSRRIHKEVVEHLTSGGSIKFAIATEVRSDNGTIDLRRTAARRFAENAAVFMAQTTADTRVLNVDADLDEAGDEGAGVEDAE
jgi:hypothetical protein